MKYTTKDGFVWEVISKEKAIALIEANAEVYKVYEDESESLIHLEDELWDTKGLVFYAIESKQYPVKWARKDSATGKGMNKGFCCFDGDYYFENQSDLIKWLRDRNVDEYKELSDEFLLDEAYAEEEYYYSEWDVDDSDYYYEEQADGTLIEINK
jgi:hypothetical protein